MEHKPRSAIHMEKQLGWARKLGGVECVGIAKAAQTVLARLTESQIWHHLASSEQGGFRNRPLLALMSDTSVSLSMPLVPFKLLPQYWSSERVSLSS